ncbi:hypothetical protein [Mycobacterium sp. E740]|uniref:hypothetical protein n=1 Tax=Mycobacterium sp. E740 TaxID=1834149 RepID=UPI0007FE1B82|nr:hypothetical protein [Mycobacterium sp. E740]OBI82329.1 hypothetical protein A5663_14505 [Mycobacterium sp. E740]
MTETLRIDTGLVVEAGGRLQAVAAAIPAPPESYSPPGGDALSTAIAAKVAEVVDPVIAQLPITKEELAKYAQNVVNAGNTYDEVDRQVAEQILKRVEGMDDASNTGGGPGVASSAVGTAQQSGPMGQMAQPSTGTAPEIAL